MKVGQLRQKVMYEGVSSLFYCCGRLGHKQDSCPYQIRPPEKEVEEEASAFVPDSQTKQQPEPQYGDWMLVTKKKAGS